MGGVAVDLAGRSSLSGLWACGEVACTGAHGGNRLASNSLLEALVFGAGVGDDIEAQGPERPDARSLWRNPVWLAGRRLAPAQPDAGGPLRSRVRELAWRRVGVVRDASGLSAALDELDRLAAGHPAPAGETRNLLEVARLVAAAALMRRESRGAHWRSDHPATDPAAARRTLATAAELELAVLAARPRTAAGTPA
jgi:L-aspartate oxidase